MRTGYQAQTGEWVQRGVDGEQHDAMSRGLLASQSCLSLAALLLHMIFFFFPNTILFCSHAPPASPLRLTDILLCQHIIFGFQYNLCRQLFLFVLQASAEWCSCLGCALYSTTPHVCDFIKVR